ncbi:MAG: hypothetical protein EOP49_48980 [Sphingobacteriales bacterium]|nr:MAG: hypothetical protein EOP49_48980 [Sphingobacteriales bacterium]
MGRKQTYAFERSGNGYRLNLGLRASGPYTFTAKTTYNGRSYMVNGRFAVQNMPIELMETGADYSLLYALSSKYQGALVDRERIGTLYDSISKNPSVKPVIETHAETIPLVDWKWYFVLIVVFAVAEWLLRKYWMAQ